MRFAMALVALLIAGLLVASGIAQRTILKPADHITLAADVPADVRYVLVPGALLQSHAGQQRLHVGGADVAFAAYGRTSDVTAWLSGQRYAELRVDESGAMEAPVMRTAPVVAGLRGGTPDPDGADVWVDQQREQRALDWTLDLPSSMSVLVAADGSAAAPSDLRVTWPVRTGTPFAVPLIVVGGALAVVGLLLYVWALIHVRQRRGPRRKSPPKMPKRPQPPRYRPQRPASAAPVPGRGRRSVRHRTGLGWAGPALVGVLLVGTLLAGTPFGPPAGLAAAATRAPGASMTEEQATRVVRRAAEVAAKADEELDAKLLAERFTGAALELRRAAYTLKKKQKKLSLPVSLPVEHAVVNLLVPETQTGWPRSLFVVVADSEKPKVAPVALALVQLDPRADYKVQYAMALRGGITLPTMPSAVDGATRLRADTPVLQVEPGALAAEYGAVLLDGESAAGKEFDTSDDPLVKQVGEAFKKKYAKKYADTTKTSFSDRTPDPSTVIALSTADSGALVAVQLEEQFTVKPKRSGVVITTSGGTKILSKTDSTAKGIRSVYGYQLLFAVPSAGSDEPVVLLGYDQGLISAKEL